MHFTSPVHRPAYENRSLCLQVTSGCSHNACRFCSYFKKVDYRESSLEEIEGDLKELCNLPRFYPKERMFLQAADAFALDYDRLMRIAELVKRYLPSVKSIGAYARIDDVTDKSVEQLASLRDAGYANLFIGIETGDDYLLNFMDKGFSSKDILEQCAKLNEARLTFSVSIINGLGGHNYGYSNAIQTARVINEIRPLSIRPESLVVMPDTPLAEDIRKGAYVEATELERLRELVVLLDNLTCETTFGATQATLPMRLFGKLPSEREALRKTIADFIEVADEDELRQHRLDVMFMLMPEHAVPDPMTPLLKTTKNARLSPRHNISWGRDFNPLA